MISYNQLIRVLESFANAHLQVKRFGAEFKEQLPNLSTDGVSFPYLFVVPIGTVTGEFVKEIEVEIYCIDRLRKDRENSNDVVSDTEQILTDLAVWLEDGQTSVDVVRSYSAVPLNNDTLDFVAGWSQRFKFELERIAECEIPMTDATSGIGCEDASYVVEYENGTEIESGTIASGGSAVIVVPNPSVCDDATAVLKDTNGTTISTTNIPSGDTQDIEAPDATYEVKYADNTPIENGSIVSGGSKVVTVPNPVCDPVTLDINDTEEGTFDSGTTIDLQLIDEDTNPVTPVSVGVVGQAVTVTLPNAGVNPVGATLMKTGQTTSYRTGDDGDTQRGREVDFFNLSSNNPFENQKRFTGITGGYQDETDSLFYDKDGVLTTEALAFPDDIVLDFSTNGLPSDKILGYKRTPQTAGNWNAIIDANENITYAGFANWNTWNLNEYRNIVSMAKPSTSQFSHPFTVLNSDTYLWNSTTDAGNTDNSWIITQESNQFYRTFPKTGASLKTVIVRVFTITGTTLT